MRKYNIYIFFFLINKRHSNWLLQILLFKHISFLWPFSGSMFKILFYFLKYSRYSFIFKNLSKIYTFSVERTTFAKKFNVAHIHSSSFVSLKILKNKQNVIISIYFRALYIFALSFSANIYILLLKFKKKLL